MLYEGADSRQRDAGEVHLYLHEDSLIQVYGLVPRNLGEVESVNLIIQQPYLRT